MIRSLLATLALLAATASAQTTRPFVAGVDANYALELERAGKTWQVGGAKADPFAALEKAGFDGFRVRLWTGDDGPNGLTYAIETARRAQAAGLKPYLIIFLSENWADLVKQPVPAIWKNLDADAKLSAIEAYAEGVTRRFADAGMAIDTYEIGNEIDFGLCGVFEEEWPKRVSIDYMRENIWRKTSPMILAAQRGVRKAKPEALFTLHLAQWNNVEYCIAFWRFMREQGVAVDFAGLSYFPTSVTRAEERPLAFLAKQADAIHTAIGVSVLICETGFPSEPNFLGQFAEWNKPIDGYALSVDGQKKWLADFLAMARTTPSIAGAYYWSPEGTTGDLWRAFALFDVEGNARPALATTKPTTAPSALNVYFGNLHAHTAYSDGSGTPTEAFTYARDVAKLDFMAITEHNHLLGGANATMAKRRQLYAADEATALVPVSRKFTEDGKFVAIAGQEFSSMSKGNHVNVFDVDEVIDVPNGAFDGLIEWMNKHRASNGERAILMFNHPGLGKPGKGIPENEFGRDDFGDDATWIKTMGEVTSLVELLNGDPLPGVLRKASEQMMERHFLLYLQLGFKLAPTGDQDNHKKDWGNSTETRTGIVAPALTKAAILDAMRARHVYATEDRNLRAIVRVNGSLAGDVIPKAEKTTITYDLRDGDEPKASYTIEVFHGTIGGEIASVVKTVTATGDGVGTIDGVTLDANQYLFLRITQTEEAGRDRVWTAPVWCE